MDAVEPNAARDLVLAQSGEGAKTGDGGLHKVEISVHREGSDVRIAVRGDGFLFSVMLHVLIRHLARLIGRARLRAIVAEETKEM